MAASSMDGLNPGRVDMQAGVRGADGRPGTLAALERQTPEVDAEDVQAYVSACMDEIASQTAILHFLNARMGGRLLEAAVALGDDLSRAGLQVN